ncbi:MAG: hypothetical protein B6I20_05275 [Bacteroidetes bacterium 4572_117]|nr:MAG: hypothetical protein B6I20_05275 [Bacteroidetes bacterium 4572_117]
MNIYRPKLNFIQTNFLILISVLLILFSGCTEKEKPFLMVYCGSGLKEQMKIIKLEFEKKHDIQIKVIDSGISNLIEAIYESKKGDLIVYISTSDKPKLPDVEQNTHRIGSRKLVMVTNKKNTKNIRSFNDLYKDSIRIAIGDPTRTIVGKFFKKIVEKSKFENELNNNIAFMTNTAAKMMSLVEKNKADVAIIIEDVIPCDKYKNFVVVKFPEKINVDLGIYISELSISKNKKNARLFSDFVKKEGKKILKKWREK